MLGECLCLEGGGLGSDEEDRGQEERVGFHWDFWEMGGGMFADKRIQANIFGIYQVF
jgi:hypothetical protein